MAKKKKSGSSAASIAVKLQQLSNQATEKSFKYNAEEANTARTWQKEMSDTSHQREVEDLKAAGLNPILSAGGSGAQSYTTSAASAQAENAANAVGNVYSSEISANATKAAAAASAKAMRDAAATTAAAQRYAAAMAFESQKYHSDKAYQATKYKADKDYKTQMDKPGSTWSAVFDKWLQKNGVQKNLSSWAKTGAKTFTSNKASANKFKLTTFGNIQAGNNLKKLGIANTQANRNKIAKATFFNDKSSQTWLQTQTKLAKAKKQQSKKLVDPYGESPLKTVSSAWKQLLRKY